MKKKRKKKRNKKRILRERVKQREKIDRKRQKEEEQFQSSANEMPRSDSRHILPQELKKYKLNLFSKACLFVTIIPTAVKALPNG